MTPLTEDHLAIYRRHMVEVIDIHFDRLREELGKPRIGERLRTAFLKVPRHHFVARDLVMLAYHDGPLPIGFDKTISQPFIAAVMIDLLDVQASDNVLEIGTGYGFQTAVLAELAEQVWSIDVVEEFIEMAQQRMDAMGYHNVKLHVGDGSKGWPDELTFDKIIVSAAASEVPAKLLKQLKPGGKMVLPLGRKDVQQITLVDKQDDRDVVRRPIMPARFMPLETL